MVKVKIKLNKEFFFGNNGNLFCETIHANRLVFKTFRISDGKVNITGTVYQQKSVV
jgi:hypothetical protein